MSENKISRRKFLSYSAAVGATAVVSSSILSSCAGGNKSGKPLKKKGEYYVPELPDKAIDGRELKVGLVGCGGRGSGAVKDLLEAANGITVAALGDVFEDRLNDAKKMLAEEKNQVVPDDA